MKTLALLLGLTLLAPACRSTGGELRPAATRPATTSIKVIPLRFASAVELAVSLKNVARDVRIVADARTNALIVSYEDEAALREVEHAVVALDVEVPVKR